MKYILVALAVLMSVNLSFAELEVSYITAAAEPENAALNLQNKRWNHGSEDCSSSDEPTMEVYRYDQSSYIIRQSKCQSFEAPFIYVLIGKERALVLDTGAPAAAEDFPLYETVLTLLEEQSLEASDTPIELMVVHSHSHRDHRSGDSQFAGKPNVTIVEPNLESVEEILQIDSWPDGVAGIQLGGRELVVIPTPGHQEEAISIYDPQTRWLLTGDTLYPGYIYVKDWNAYKDSIARLVNFSETYEIGPILGGHIEMTREPGEYYPIGTTYQPNEAALPLSLKNLLSLHAALIEDGRKQELNQVEFMVAPMNTFQKTLSNFARWITQ